MTPGPRAALVLVDHGVAVDVAPLRLAGADVTTALVATPPAMWSASDVYSAASAVGPAHRILNRARRVAGGVLHRPEHIELLPRKAMPGQVVEWKHWLSAALAQTTSLVRRAPGLAVVVVVGERAEIIGWHLVRSHPDLVVIAGTLPAARLLKAEADSYPDDGDLSVVAPLIRDVEVVYQAVPDRPDAPRVVQAPLDTADAADGSGDVVVVVEDADKPVVTLSAEGRAVLLRRPVVADVVSEQQVLSGRLPTPASWGGGESSTGGLRLLIGPANYSGQASAWARALGEPPSDRDAASGGLPSADPVLARNVSVVSPQSPFSFPSDVVVTTTEWPLAAVRARLAAREIVPATHVLAEAMRPIAALGTEGYVHPSSPSAGALELERLLDSGRTVGVVLHGSEARRPDDHLAAYPFSPFGDAGHAPEWAKRRTQTQTVHDTLERLDVTTFVTTPDMLDFVPGATWLPLVLPAGSFRPGRALFGDRLPVVLHAPSSGALKGSAVIDAVLAELDSAGLITYRRLAGVPSYELLAHIRGADVVVDQIVMGNNGVLATQALASGRVVLAHLLPHVRAHYGIDVPVVEADPTSLRSVLLEVIGDRERSVATAAQGPEFARTFHDGTRTRVVLQEFLRPTPSL